MSKHVAWSFKTARYEVRLLIEDEDLPPEDTFERSEDIEAIREGRGEYFCAHVQVLKDGKAIADDYLGGCWYDSFNDFYASHRTGPDAYRNTLANKARGVSYVHYFPDMVRSAISEARQFLND